jgi:hypothetical protein
LLSLEIERVAILETGGCVQDIADDQQNQQDQESPG